VDLHLHHYRQQQPAHKVSRKGTDLCEAIALSASPGGVNKQNNKHRSTEGGWLQNIIGKEDGEGQTEYGKTNMETNRAFI